MTSLAASLPQEIVHHIVQFAAGTPDELDLNYRLTRYPLLRRCALVCRSFRPVAQALLWEKVDLKTLYQVAALRRTKGTWGRTRELRYDAIGATSKAQLKVLSLFPALEKLVYSRATVEPEVLLALPSMAGLRCLGYDSHYQDIRCNPWKRDQLKVSCAERGIELLKGYWDSLVFPTSDLLDESATTS